jgi:hypothetical protein
LKDPLNSPNSHFFPNGSPSHGNFALQMTSPPRFGQNIPNNNNINNNINNNNNSIINNDNNNMDTFEDNTESLGMLYYDEY